MSSKAIYTRLARHFVARLARDRALEAIESAIALGVLERVEQPDNVSFFRQGPKIAGWLLGRVKLLLRAAFGSLSDQGQMADSSENKAAPGGPGQPSVSEERLEGLPRSSDEYAEDLLQEGSPARPVSGLSAGPDTGKRRAKRSVAAAAARAAAADVAAVPVAAAGVVAEAQGGAAEKLAQGSGKASARRKRLQPPLDRRALLRLVRRHATPPAATQVATLLLLADAVARSGHDIADLLAILRRPKPVVAITGTVDGFEAAFLDLLRCGLVLPGSCRFISAYDLHTIGEQRLSATAARSLILFRGKEASDDAELVARKVSLAVQNSLPILAVADDADQLPQALIDTADINLVCRPVTPYLISQVMQVVLGGPRGRLAGLAPERTFPAASDASLFPEGDQASVLLDGCELLTITDLGLAIRPGMSAERSIARLRSLIARARKARLDERRSADNHEDSSFTRKDSSRRGQVSSGSIVIEPEPIDEAGTSASGKPPLLVEALAGYGAARNWALALKDDLEFWREGHLDWSEMSTRLLLAGPPGTGKTTFAKALANSLQLKLFATSVATWLEPGNLGEVLRRMSAAFAEAAANAPCILFIDEIDGIGYRRSTGSQRPYDDYWVAVVNRALELLDGVVKSEGVIVLGATNHPEAIDRALLRSGRLETRIDIPLPDVHALVGILRHHLAQDLDAVVESAATKMARLPESTGTEPSGSGRWETGSTDLIASNAVLEHDRSQGRHPDIPTVAAEVPRPGDPPGIGEGPARSASARPRRSIDWPWITTLIHRLTGGTRW